MSPLDINSDSMSAAPPDSNGALVTLGNRYSQVPALPWNYGIPTRPEILSARPNPVELMHALRRRWVTAVGLGLVVAGMFAALVWYFLPVNYEAVALIRVRPEQQKVFEAVQSEGSNAGFESFKRTQQVSITSSMVLMSAFRNPEISRLETCQAHKDDMVGWLQGELNVDFPQDSEVMRISLKGEKKQDLPKIVNAVQAAYMKEVVDVEAFARKRRMSDLQQAAAAIREDLNRKREGIDRLARTVGSSDTESFMMKRKLLMETVDTHIRQRDAIADAISQCDMKIHLIEKQKELTPVGVSNQAIENEVNRDPGVRSIIEQIARYKEDYEEAQGLLVDKNAAKLKEIRNRVSRAEERLEEVRAEVRNAIQEQVSSMPTDGGLANSIPMLEAEKEILDKKLEKVNGSLTSELEKFSKLETSNTDLEQRKAEARNLSQIYDRMSGQLSVWQIEINAPPRVQVLEEAQLPSGNNALRKNVTAVGAGLIGFGLLLIGVAMLEFQARRLNSPREVSEGLGIRVMGDLPTLSARTWRKLQSGGSKAAALEALLNESIDSIRTTLIHTNSVESPRVIMVTSAEAHEGKTTVASQLAASLARSGRRTLLVDGDLRNPALHRVFEIQQEPGICELLRGEVERAAVIHPTRSTNLWLAPAGQADMRSVQSLSSDVIGDVIGAWRSEFDFVVIDSAPTLKVADPLLLGQHIDAAIIAVLRDISRMPRVYEAVERLRSVGVTVLGAVVNGVNSPAPRRLGELQLTEPAAEA